MKDDQVPPKEEKAYCVHGSIHSTSKAEGIVWGRREGAFSQKFPLCVTRSDGGAGPLKELFKTVHLNPTRVPGCGL